MASDGDTADTGSFEDRYRALLESPPPEVAAVRVAVLPGDRPPWTRTGLRLRRGDAYSLLAEGRIAPPPGLELSGRPRFVLWSRVGSGRAANGSQDTTTRRADADGELELATLQGEWASPRGDLATPVEAYAGVRGALRVLVVHWRGDPQAGLAALAARCPQDPLVRAEQRRLAQPVAPPPGWTYHWRLGQADIFREEVDPDTGERAVAAHAEDDVGIVCHPLRMELAPGLRLDWRWRVDALPSALAEDQLPQHDYLSVALEFDDGRDLTWYWSAALPPDTHFACPIPTWAPRETHWVVRSGTDGLGRWHAESRDVWADATRVYGRPPSAVVAVWLIAVALFQRGRAEARFADIELTRGTQRLRVGP